MKTINVDFTDSTVGNVGRAGEHNNTKIIFALSPELAKCDFLTAEVGTAAGEKVPIEGTYNEENSTFSILLTNQLTIEGAISFQLVGYVTESETAEPQIIAKSPLVSGFITQGINGVETEADSNPKLLARIWAKVREWADKIHTHDNKNTLDGFYCEAAEYVPPEDDFPTIGSGDNKSDRLEYDGNQIRYVNDGDVISSVEKTDTEITIYLADVEQSSGVAIQKNPIVIPLGGGEGGSSHEHKNKELLDEMTKGKLGNLSVGNAVHWCAHDGSVIEKVETDETTGDITIYNRLVPNTAIPAEKVKIKQHYKTSELENDKKFVTAEDVTAAINGSLDEIEAMIDESGVLTE